MEFSVIIPVYNVAPYLRQCLDSLCSQTFRDWEAICIDDGSTDESGRILDGYAVVDNRFRVFHVPNGGVSNARNFALKKAGGQYIGFIDGDDVVSVRWVETAHFVAEKCSHPDIIRMNLKKWLPDSPLPTTSGGCSVETYHGLAAEKFCLNEFSRSGQVWRNFIRRSLAVATEFPLDLTMREDVIYMLRIVPNLTSVAICGYDGYFYRMREDSAAHQLLNPAEMLLFLGKYKDLCKDNEVFTRTTAKLLHEWFRYVGPRSRSFDRLIVDYFCECNVEGRYYWKDVPFFHKVMLKSVIMFCTLAFAEAMSDFLVRLNGMKGYFRQHVLVKATSVK